MNYKVMYLDYYQSGINKVCEDVDNERIFKTYTEAKQKLITFLVNDKNSIKDRIKQVQRTTKREFGL